MFADLPISRISTVERSISAQQTATSFMRTPYVSKRLQCNTISAHSGHIRLSSELMVSGLRSLGAVSSLGTVSDRFYATSRCIFSNLRDQWRNSDQPWCHC